MKISIAMATYNGGKYLQEQLDSFVAQTRRPDELVITDDGSTDDTLEIIERFARSAPFEVVWSQNEKNLGYARNFNAALIKTTGDLVFLSDQDDVWFSDKIEKLARLAETDQRNLVFINDASLTDKNLNEKGITKLEQIRSAGIKEHCFVMGACAAIKRELLNICLPIPSKYPSHDGWIVTIADGLGRKKIIDVVLQYYRRHEKNESQWIANRTTKITRWSYRLNSFRIATNSILYSESSIKSNNENKFIHERLILDWLSKKEIDLSIAINNDLFSYRQALQIDVDALEKRAEIRELKLPSRIFSVLRFWRSGGYSRFSGIDSVMRDILLP